MSYKQDKKSVDEMRAVILNLTTDEVIDDLPMAEYKECVDYVLHYILDRVMYLEGSLNKYYRTGQIS